MNNAIVRVAVGVAGPFLINVLRDMITSERVKIFREDTKKLLLDLASKTETEIDDLFVESVFEKAFTAENISKYGLKLISMAKGYVVMTETKYDDKFALPILQRFEEVLTVQ